MKVVFMGTPGFAVPCLEGLLATGYKVEGVFTQPDQPKGRGYALTPPPVKVLAVEAGIPVYQPQSLKDAHVQETIRSLNSDIIVVVAYGKILPPAILRIPPLGCVNVHASLLPQYRGAAPIQWAVLKGEDVTGITTMQMDEGLDTGAMLLQKKLAILPNETAGELHDRLMELGKQTLLDTLSRIQGMGLWGVPQDNHKATYAPMLRKDMSPIDWSMSAQQVHNQVRGLNPWPGATTQIEGTALKIHRTYMTDKQSNAEPGEVIECGARLLVCCGDGGVLSLEELQLAGKKRMAAADFLRGAALTAGIRFG